MADSNITKRALANSLKTLMLEKPFDKININDICVPCDMNRKSFYYHFKDKYDLVNWIFDTEFMEFVGQKSLLQPWDFFKELLNYFYENHRFYRKALQIKGQNSFSDHFHEYMVPVVIEFLKNAYQEEYKTEHTDFFTLFVTDAITCAIERWLLDKNCLSSDEFFELLLSCIISVHKKVTRDIQLLENSREYNGEHD